MNGQSRTDGTNIASAPTIREIVDDAEGSFDDGWPTHPQDIEEKGDEERRFRTVYLGGAGVVQALD